MSGRLGIVVFDAAQNALDALGLRAAKPPVPCSIGSTFRESGSSCVSLGISGDVVGALVVSFSPQGAAGIASELAQQSIGADDEEEIRCAMAEMTNVIAGYAATEFDEGGLTVSITPPTAIAGPEIHLDFPQGAENQVESFELVAGTFTLIVSLHCKDTGELSGGNASDPQRFRLSRD